MVHEDSEFDQVSNYRLDTSVDNSEVAPVIFTSFDDDMMGNLKASCRSHMKPLLNRKESSVS